MKLIIIYIAIFFSISLHADEFDGYKETCKTIGYKVGTEKFGDCVLELRRRDHNKQLNENSKIKSTDRIVQHAPQEKENPKEASSKELANKEYLEQAKQYFANQQVLYDKQMALYEQQKRNYEEQQAEAEKERKMAASRKLMEFGLRMAAGTSPYASVNADRAWADTNGTRPVMQQPSMPTIQPPTSYSIQTRNGYVYCTYEPYSHNVTCN
jgi:hypothetical protein